MGSDPPPIPPPVPPPAAPPAPPLGYAVPAQVFEGRLHPLTIAASLLRALQQLLPIVILAIVFRAIGRSSDMIELVIGGLGLMRVVGALILWSTYRYYIDGTSLHIRSGIIFQQRRAIPLDRIQNINIKRDWIHQLLGVAEVQVETASGAGAEATLSSLGLAQAELLRRQLLGGREEQAGPAAGGETAEPPAEVVYEASVGQLLLAGATRNQAGTVVAAVIGFGFWLQDLIGWDLGESTVRQLAKVLPQVGHQWILVAIGVFLLIAVGWLVSMARSVITFFGFRLERQTEGRLRRTYGLFTKRETVFPTHRLQVLRVEAPLIQRKLGLCRVIAQTAGSFAEQESAATSELCPIIRRQRVQDVCRLVLPGMDLGAVAWKKVSRKTIRRAMFRYVFLLLVLVGLAGLSTRFAAWGLVLLPLCVVGAIWRYRALRWAVTDDLVLLRRGVWTRVIAAVPRNKIQHTTAAATPMQRRMRLASLGIRTAGGAGGSGIVIPDLPVDVAERVQDHLTQSDPLSAQRDAAR